MFGKLKDKLKGALSKFSKDISEEAEIIDETQEQEETELSQEELEVKIEEKNTDEEAEQKADDTVAEENEDADEEAEQKADDTVAEENEDLNETQEEKVEEILPEEKEKKQLADIAHTSEEKEKQTLADTKDKQEAITKDECEKEQDSPVPEEQEKKTGFFGSLFKKRTEEKSSGEEQDSEKSEEASVPERKKEKKESFFGKLHRISLSEEKFEELFWELEIVLLENNVAVEVIERIKEDLKKVLTGEKSSKKTIETLIADTLKNTLQEILSVEQINLMELAKEKNSQNMPLVIAMIGVNGSGKTTTLAKLIYYFQKNNKSIVVAAADTFRAAAIQQVEEHTTALGVKLIQHDYNADPAAVAYDAISHAKAKGLDIVLIDTAGRLHSNDNLMEELKKLIRINTPDIKLFVGEAITGNDCVEQAKLFNEAVGIDGIILAKADVDEKGGAAISASYITGKPVLFLGTGQNYSDLEVFSVEKIIRNLDL